MHLDTTYRGLTRKESQAADRAVAKGAARFERLLEGPCVLRAVFESGPKHRATLTLSVRRHEFTATASNHDIAAAVSDACDKIKVQLVKQRQRRSGSRHRAARVSV